MYGLLRTSDALSKSVKAEQVLFSLVLFTLVYATLFVLFLYLLNKKIHHGPERTTTPEEEDTEHFGVRENPMLAAGGKDRTGIKPSK